MKVTIQDIADELGISRNTVSKAINNSDGIAESTREMILQKAAEMGYKQFSYIKVANGAQNAAARRIQFGDGPTEIALFTTIFLNNSHFASLMLDKLQQDLSQLGYTMNTHRITQANRAALSLPNTFSRERTAAVICVEVFDRRYADLVCSLGLPVLFVDGPAKTEGYSVPADQLYMENSTGITRFVSDMLRLGVKHIGFIGDYEHCQSFYERYTAFRCAMLLAELPVEDRHIVKTNYLEKIEAALNKLDKLPEVFICANDFVAMDTVRILQKRGLSVPGDVEICGFDDAPESRHLSPHLTTVHIHTQVMAFSAVQLLLTRIKEPSLDCRMIYTDTELIYRESTRSPKTEAFS